MSNENNKKKNFTTEISTVLAAELPELEIQNLEELDGATAVRKYRATVNKYYTAIDELRIAKKKEMEALFKIKWDEMTKDHSDSIKTHLEVVDKELKKRDYQEKMLALKDFHTETFIAINEITKEYNLKKDEAFLLYDQFMLEDNISQYGRITSNIKIDIEDFVVNVLLVPEDVQDEEQQETQTPSVDTTKQTNKEQDIHNFTMTFTNTSVSKIISILRKEGITSWRYQKTLETK